MQNGYLHFPTSPEQWKGLKEKFRWKVDHAARELDGKHIAMKKSKKSGSDYLQLQGLLFPGSPDPGQYRIQIPIDKLWFKWFLLR